MINRWDERAAEQAVKDWGREHGRDLALRLYSARLLGTDHALVLHGGGNVSLKRRQRTLLGDEIDVVHVKASGCDLADVDAAHLPALDLNYLRRLRTLDALDDAEMVNQFRTHLLDASAPTPSIETLLHVFLPHRYVDHSHADAVLVLTNQPNGQQLIRQVLADRVAILPYVTPGFELAKAAADAFEANPGVEGMILLQHGLITFGDDARTAYDRHLALVESCERAIDSARQGRRLTATFNNPPSNPPPWKGGAGAGSNAEARGDQRLPVDAQPGTAAAFHSPPRPATPCPPPQHETDSGLDPRSPGELGQRVALAAPILRGLLAHPTGDADRPYLRSIMEWRNDESTLEFVNSAEAAHLAPTGPLTSDHLIRVKAAPLFVALPDWNDPARLRTQLERAVADYRHRYTDYLRRCGGDASTLDTAPRVVLLPGAGALCWGPTKHDACFAADITEHTLAAKTAAHLIGRYVALAEEHLFAMEYRGLQLAKLDASAPRPLAGQVVAVSGGAGAIGFAIAEACIRAGAHVFLADLDADRLSHVIDQLRTSFGPGVAAGTAMNVTDEASVRAGFDQACRTFGGVDVVVPNAGIAHASPVESMNVADFRRVMDINATGYLLFMREGIRVLKQQRLGGNIVVNASKNVFGPGKDFGAYSASKAAGHQLAKVAAIELAPDNIRVNMINADAVFAHHDVASGLWTHVGPERAKSRGLQAEDLPEYYRSRNLLKARVYGHHVGNAVVFFAGNLTPTTGATLPVDGGIIDAFPR